MLPLVKWRSRRPRIQPSRIHRLPIRGMRLLATEESVAPAATDVAPDTTSKEALADTSGPVDPAKEEWTDPAPVDPASSAPGVDPTTGESVDPATVKEVEPAPVDAAPVAPAPSDAPAPPNTAQLGWD